MFICKGGEGGGACLLSPTAHSNHRLISRVISLQSPHLLPSISRQNELSIPLSPRYCVRTGQYVRLHRLLYMTRPSDSIIPTPLVSFTQLEIKSCRVRKEGLAYNCFSQFVLTMSLATALSREDDARRAKFWACEKIRNGRHVTRISLSATEFQVK